MIYNDLNDKLKIKIENAEKLAIESISNNNTFSPYIVYGKDMKKIKRLISNSIDEAIDIAEVVIDEISDETETAILVYKDKIKLNDGTFNAIICQVYDDDEESGYSFGQIYKIINSKLSFSNERIFLGEIRNLILF